MSAASSRSSPETSSPPARPPVSVSGRSRNPSISSPAIPCVSGSRGSVSSSRRSSPGAGGRAGGARVAGFLPSFELDLELDYSEIYEHEPCFRQTRSRLRRPDGHRRQPPRILLFRSGAPPAGNDPDLVPELDLRLPFE